MIEYAGKGVTIMCCSKCNTKCKHCYISYKGNINSVELLSMVKTLSKKYDVALNGTELLLNLDYLQSLSYLHQERILTNGLVIHNNPQLILRLKDNGIEWICMSYHFKLHSKVSEIDKKIIMDNIELLKKCNMKIEIMTTISKLNLYEIEEMVNSAIMFGVDCIRFTNYFNLGNAKQMNYDQFVLTDQELEIFFDQFYEMKKKYSSEILIRRSGLFSRDVRKKNSTYYCPAGENAVAITPDFKVYPCPFLVEDGYDIGKYENGKIIINDIYDYDHCNCLTHLVSNRGKKLVKKNDY